MLSKSKIQALKLSLKREMTVMLLRLVFSIFMHKQENPNK